MSRLRLAFLFTWGVIFGLSQILLLIICSAFHYEPTIVVNLEIFTAITTSIIAALLVAKEEIIDGKEIFRKE